MSKSKTLLRAHFWSNYAQTFFGWCKITQILCHMFFLVKKVKYWVYFLDLSVKNPKGWSDRLETWHAETLDPVLKKARKQQFYPGSPSLWIWHLKCTNISQIFSLPGSGQKLLDSFFMGFGQLYLIHILSAACLNCNWFFGNSTVFNSYPNINWKWNCKGDNIQIFLSEIILSWENGSQGHHFGKILNSKFVKVLCHCAVFHCVARCRIF